MLYNDFFVLDARVIDTMIAGVNEQQQNEQSSKIAFSISIILICALFIAVNIKFTLLMIRDKVMK